MVLRVIYVCLYNVAAWCINEFAYSAHLEGQRHHKGYERYDFSRDLKYKRWRKSL